MRPFRPLVALLLSLSLLWSSVQQAVAHVGMTGGMEVTLCTTTGQEVTIVLDANGNPVPAHDCQDCLATQASDGPAAPFTLPLPVRGGPAIFRTPVPFVALDLSAPHPAQPRGPPSAV